MTFGKMPIANGFLSENELENEYFFDLSPAFCNICYTFQIENQPAPSAMFHENYAFFSRQSKSMQKHFLEYAEWIDSNYMKSENPFIIELGSNDGILLEYFAKKNIGHLGVEPSANVAKEAQKYGVNTTVNFFSFSLAETILREYGQVDVITASNVMCHIPDLNEIANGIDILLKDNGVLIFEDPYLGEMIEKTSYDQIYDEHVYIFSAMSVQNIFSRVGLEIIDLKPQKTHGGSMRYILGKKGNHIVSSAVKKVYDLEVRQGLNLDETYNKFRVNCEKSKNNLIEILQNEKNIGNRVVAYGATSKSTTILNYCNIGPELIEYISDTTPIKQNKLSPGMHIPIKPHEEFIKNPPNTTVLFAWNHADEIMSKEKDYIKNKGKWIVHVPTVKKF